ncbi:TetR/AcrR family transcriptional regulator (plasmid) [Methylocystis sp. MJC1]|uniref:TetR/AcrR family transcriptional regulator n=1 Tax=Methylocystis sp. MJC1 TaxID=2654282 RepID=UPI0013E9ABCB|nr:TetR/AcrR family transcriptional regulator [Methylocystis sp. MJC1]KAF2989272.1 HTH-type transcriptional regulator TtgR [Methylocystis sp. MJC1]MBU6529303.1 TetR/AcrR family transcriptional regulator [Methylocystis sp. MJC1]UZX14164.1 TetR/AcrR family transcriptional regulator [Methylocystis sp. MJC1]
MRYQADHKEQARARLVEAAGRGFRKRGYGGIGVDGLAKEAGVTSGAFYGHFKSKDEAFKVAVEAGLDELYECIGALQEEQGDAWLAAFIDLYLGPKRTCELGMSCALQSLTPEVQRADSAIRSVFEERARRVARAIARGLVGAEADRLARAWALLALLSGGVTLARACESEEAGAQVAEGVRLAALAIAVGS